MKSIVLLIAVLSLAGCSVPRYNLAEKLSEPQVIGEIIEQKLPEAYYCFDKPKAELRQDAVEIWRGAVWGSAFDNAEPNLTNGKAKVYAQDVAQRFFVEYYGLHADDFSIATLPTEKKMRCEKMRSVVQKWRNEELAIVKE